MARFDSERACDELMVQGLQALLRVVVLMAQVERARVEDTEAHVVAERHHAAVDFVEGKPIVALALVVLHDGLGVLDIAVDGLARCPTIYLLAHGEGHLIVAEGDERLDVVLRTFVHDTVIKRKASLVGLVLKSRREDARPVHREAENLEAHLGEKRDVFLVVMIEIDTVMARIEFIGVEHRRDLARVMMVAIGGHVHTARALAVDIPSTFELVGSSGTAPQEVFGENAHRSIPFLCNGTVG